ncbi:MAG: PD-(D/E)XK nuclease family protein [Actinomycetia bacterium]|nr:PD-(D/E)XK nuclease family protein [Actinomycetes bacterium]
MTRANSANLTIITGPAQAGKTQVCIETLACSAPAEIVLVCATTYLADSLGRRLALQRRRDAAAQGATPQLTTTTFRKLTEKLWSLHGDERALIGQAAREALIDELLARLSSPDQAPSLFTAGGRQLLVDLVQSLALTDQAGPATALPRAIKNLGSAYQQLLRQRGLIESDSALLDLAQRSIYLPAAYSFLGFTDFPLAQGAYVGMLSTQTEVVLAVTCEQQGEASEEGRRFAADEALRYRQMTGRDAQRLQVATRPDHEAAAELCALRATFLCEGAPDTKKPRSSALEIRCTQGEDEEIRAAVQAALENINASTLQSNIAVQPVTDDAPVALIFRHLGLRIGRIAQLLDVCGVPAAFDLRIPFVQTGLGAALFALLRLPYADDDLAQVATGYLLSAYSGTAQIRAADLERFLREKSPGYSAQLCDKLGVPELRRLRAQGWADLATELLFRGATLERSDYLHQLDFAAHQAFLTRLAELRELSRDDSSALLAGLSTARVNLTPSPGSRRLLVSEVSRVRGRQFRTVILAGLAQQDFRAAIEPSLAERAVAQITGRGEPDKLVGEHQLWYDLLGCAREKLILIARDRDVSGQELAPSGLLEELSALIGQQSDPPEPGPQLALSLQEVAFQPRRSGRAAPPRGQLRGLDFAAYAQPPFAVTTLERYARCPYAWFLNSFVARRRIQEDRDAINEGFVLHETLRRFYVAAPARLGAAHVRRGALDEAHRLLDRCFDEACQDKLDLAPGQSPADLPGPTQVSLAALRQSLHSFLESEIDWLPGFTPSYFEKPFGADLEPGAESGPLVGGVPVTGVIDRVDVCDDPSSGPEGGDGASGGALFVIDYKRSTIQSGGTLQSRVANKEIQAVSYGLVAEQLFKPLRYIGSAYRSIKNPADRKIEHRRSARQRYSEQLGFPPAWNKPPQAISDEPKADAGPSDYARGIVGIEALVVAAARGLTCGDAPITPALDRNGDPKTPCPFARDCLHLACPFYRQRGRA